MWSSFDGSFEDFYRAGKSDPGVLIEVMMRDKKKQYLIGDISPFGSIMNGDCLILKDTPVLRYKRLWAHILPRPSI